MKKVEMTRPRERFRFWLDGITREIRSYDHAAKRTIALLDTVAGGLPPDVQDRLDYYITRRHSYGYRAQLRLGNLSWRLYEMYYIDLMRIAKGFGKEFKVNPDFGCVTDIPPVASLLRTRPLAGNHDNSVLMPFNRFRHFYFPKDPVAFEDKLPAMAWRGRANKQQPRIDLLHRYHDHPEHNVGHIREQDPHPGYKGFLSVYDHLKYRYVTAFEGIEIPTNIKWIMGSNTAAICHPFHWESWYMEGRLEPGVHYVEVRRDLADLDEKLAWYNDHPEELRAIVRNANAWAKQFQDETREDLIATLVLLRYAKHTHRNMPAHLKPYQDLV